MDPIAAVDAVRRAVIDTTREGRPARVVVAERTYPASADDVWDALTNPERIPRWFLPISGDLRLGGRYSLEGNANGTIEACDPPRHLAVTWEFGGGTSWVEVHLTEAGDGDGDATILRLAHTAPVDDHWDEFGPGAVGVGWDLALLALTEHLATGAAVAFDPTDDAALAVMRRSSAAWGAADVASGTPAHAAEAAAARTTAAYTGG
jgi:uncharacterized protein YndB with AHSA1/START domain